MVVRVEAEEAAGASAERAAGIGDVAPDAEQFAEIEDRVREHRLAVVLHEADGLVHGHGGRARRARRPTAHVSAWRVERRPCCGFLLRKRLHRRFQRRGVKPLLRLQVRERPRRRLGIEPPHLLARAVEQPLPRRLPFNFLSHFPRCHRIHCESRRHHGTPPVRRAEAALQGDAPPGDPAAGLRAGVERPVARVASGRVVAGREGVAVERHFRAEVDHERHAVRAVELRARVGVEALRGAFALHEAVVGAQHLRAVPAERLPAAHERPVADLPAASAVERRLRGCRTRRRHRQAHVPRLHRLRLRRAYDG